MSNKANREMETYRLLTEAEINRLIQQGCRCNRWSEVEVAEGFDTNGIHEVYFSGSVRLGANRRVFIMPGGVEVKSGISHAHIHNCVIGDDVYIGHVKEYISNYTIGHGSFICNVGRIFVDVANSFGNGVTLSVLNESGGREMKIYNELTAQVAYLQTFYRHNKALIESLNQSIDHYVTQQLSHQGMIGKNCLIRDCGLIHNVNIGDYAELNGSSLLHNGTISSSAEAISSVGYGVQCHDFIVQSGSSITDGAMLTRCFVGQGCEIGKQFSAIDSLFFANCQMLHGEATAIFAGPYSVSHHKSTLLIGGYYSFFNAGSGSNQSNHLYKLGPTQQGVTERGCKFASDSYVMWPARIGAFSLVMGRHYWHTDNELMPFSYLVEKEGKSVLLPGVALRSVGTWRDALKWQERDKRKGELMDQLCGQMLSPYTLQKVIAGRDWLENIYVDDQDAQEGYEMYNHCLIPRDRIFSGVKYYSSIVTYYLGLGLLKHLRGKKLNNLSDWKMAVAVTEKAGNGEWLDLSGLLVPKQALNAMAEELTKSHAELQFWHTGFQEMMTRYSAYEWGWISEVIKQEVMSTDDELLPKHALALLASWDLICSFLLSAIEEDAKKEFTEASKVSYGIDGDYEVKVNDFEEVRGTLEKNSFLHAFKSRHTKLREEMQQLILALQQIVA